MVNLDATPLSTEELHKLIGADDASLRAYFASVPHPADITEFLEHAEIDQWPRLLRLIEDPEIRAEVVSQIDESRWPELLPLLTAEEIAGIISQMESDDAADLFAELSSNQRYDVLRLLSIEDRQQLQQLLRYPSDTAGGIMQIERAQVPSDASIADAVARIRALVEDDVDVIAVWVVDKENRLLGHIPIADLLLHKSTTPVTDIMQADLVFVKPEVDQEEVAQIFKKYDLMTLPVVDDENRILGRIVIDDIVDVLAEEADEDALRMGGVSTEEFWHPEAVFTTTRIRLPWLGVTLLCSLISGLLIRTFDSVLQQIIITASFIPVITAMGGNVGTQSATILIRGFATGKVELGDIPRILFKEIRVGIIMGLIFGAFGALVASLLFTDGNYYLGLVIFIAMMFAMTTASTMGVIAPAVLKRFSIDPAIAAGPFVTTLNDITGILIYMAITTLFLGVLQ